jgi:cytochrome d ubiquinol oxidase subunit II
MLLLLWTMIMRPIGFEYRSKIDSPTWRGAWDWALVASGVVPMIVYGAGVGNMFVGVPFHFNWDLTSYYTGSFITLFNPFAVLCGVLSLAMSLYMGAAMLVGRTEGAVQQRAKSVATVAVILAVVVFSVCGVWVSQMQGYRLVHSVSPALAQTPLQQQVVELAAGAWLGNFQSYPILWIVPALGYVGMILGLLSLRAGRSTLAWWLGAIAWIGVIGTAGTALFPFLMPSSSMPNQSLTVWNSVSSQTTLTWMTGWTVVFVPIVLGYTSWAFHVMRGKVKADQIETDPHAY